MLDLSKANGLRGFAESLTLLGGATSAGRTSGISIHAPSKRANTASSASLLRVRRDVLQDVRDARWINQVSAAITNGGEPSIL